MAFLYNASLTSIHHFDFSLVNFPRVFDRIVDQNAPILSEVRNLDDKETTPDSFISLPIYQDVEQHPKIDSMVAVMTSILPWRNYFLDLLPEGIDGVFLVVSNTCNQTFTYEINGPEVTYLGPSDLHDPAYDDFESTTTFTPFGSEMACVHTLSFFPSEKFESAYATNRPVTYTIVVSCIFAFMIAVFFLYDCFVERRQTKVMSTATRSTAIVSSLFPEQIADRLMEDAGTNSPKPKIRK